MKTVKWSVLVCLGILLMGSIPLFATTRGRGETTTEPVNTEPVAIDPVETEIVEGDESRFDVLWQSVTLKAVSENPDVVSDLNRPSVERTMEVRVDMDIVDANHIVGVSYMAEDSS